MNNLPKNIQQSAAIAIAEDLGNGDLTANLISNEKIASASVICREKATISGQAWFDEVFNQIDSSIEIHWLVSDGDSVSENAVLCKIKGTAKSILTAERSALNFLQTLSATATQTRRYVDLISHTNTQILDTRKTLPGLRDAQKYAVVCGGGKNHRKGLYDGILIKENHIMAAGSIQKAVQQAKALNTDIPIEVEVENLEELKQALTANADIILLDNMDNKTLRQAVSINNATNSATNNTKAKLEASGNVTLKTISAIAETGVDFISIGDLTKNIQAIDLSMRFKHS